MIVVGLEWLQWAVVACLLTLLIIYEFNNTFKYYTKFLLLDGLVMLIGVPVSYYSMFRPRRPENMRFLISFKLCCVLYLSHPHHFCLK